MLSLKPSVLPLLVHTYTNSFFHPSPQPACQTSEMLSSSSFLHSSKDSPSFSLCFWLQD